MAIDLSKFLKTYLEESFEGLDQAESSLLALEPSAPDSEEIHSIFRAIHSIKGGAGTFGLSAIGGLAHSMETLLDEMRSEQRPVDQGAVNLLLEGVDCARELLGSARDKTEIDAGRAGDLGERLGVMLSVESSSGDQAEEKEIGPQATATGEQGGGGAGGGPRAREEPGAGDGPPEGPLAATRWEIHFRPDPQMLRSGNDPVRIFRELDGLGQLTIRSNLSELPPLRELDPEECHLAWDLELLGEVPRARIDEVFEWVEGDCELQIRGHEEGAPEAPSSGLAPAREAPVEAPSPPPAPGKDPKNQRAPRAAPGGRAAPPPPARRSAPDKGSIRVGIDKIDTLINMVGELVITQSMLAQIGKDFDAGRIGLLNDGLEQLERHTRELHESVMRVRMLPIQFAFHRVRRLVHDLSEQMGKRVQLEISGEHTEVDKTVMEKLSDPLVHLVRNALDHGIEDPQTRRAAGKPEMGTLHLDAYHKNGNIHIEIIDDGAGLSRAKILKKARDGGHLSPEEEPRDEDLHDLIFAPGFTTAEGVSDVSGRGVGMDVVRRNIRSLGGSVEVVSEEGQGTTFTIRLPLTLAIVDGQLVVVGREHYIVPLINIVESVQVSPQMVHAIAGKGEMIRLRDEYLPVVQLWRVFGVESEHKTLLNGLLVIVEGDGRKVGLLVDELIGQQQVVIKSLTDNYNPVAGISGATILADGSVALILDIPSLIRLATHGTTIRGCRIPAVAPSEAVRPNPEEIISAR